MSAFDCSDLAGWLDDVEVFESKRKWLWIVWTASGEEVNINWSVEAVPQRQLCGVRGVLGVLIPAVVARVQVEAWVDVHAEISESVMR